MRQQSTRLPSFVVFIAVCNILRAPPCLMAQPAEALATCDVPFTGTASGGTLTICDTLNRNARCASIDTLPGESAGHVAERLARLIKESDPFRWGSGGTVAFSPEGTLTGLVGSCGHYMIAGSEAGLGIPPPPSSLTANYDPTSKKLHLRWTNPSSTVYNSIRLVLNYINFDHHAEWSAPGTQEGYVLDLNTLLKEGAIGDLDIWVIGVSHGVPSNAGALHVRNHVQEELFGIPFARGIAPNWTSWSTDRGGAVVGETGQRVDLVNKPGIPRYNPVRTPEAKPFYQIMGLRGPEDGAAGIRRDFLGLSPGHAYRISVRLSTLELGLHAGQWVYSLHATPYAMASTSITAQQMAGLAPLPDASQGESAALVARYDGQRTTGGRYEECVGQIVLPEGMDSIAVWLRLTGGKPENKVAMDYARLEDLGAP